MKGTIKRPATKTLTTAILCATHILRPLPKMYFMTADLDVPPPVLLAWRNAQQRLNRWIEAIPFI